MKPWLILVSLCLLVAISVVGTISNCQQDNCSSCIQGPDCMWCLKEMKKSTSFTQCYNHESSQASAWRDACEESNIVDPRYTFKIIQAESTGGKYQMKPQRVAVSLRVQEPYNISLKYEHIRNYPADLYYILDGSKSMDNDKETLAKLGGQLAEGIRNITSNFQLGFGIFVDKPTLPYVSTVPISEASCGVEKCTKPYGFKNLLPLTNDSSAFERKVEEAETAINLDSPEGGFDALMQAMVCEKQIDWRSQSVRLVVLSTDAGFHYAGDGKLGGIISPNDMSCHLDEFGSYTHSESLDYPSVSQINDIAITHSFNMIFATTESIAPLYNRLVQHIEGASSGIITEDSSNIVELLTSKVSDIVSTVELKDNATDLVKVRYFSKCMDGVMKERSKCKNLQPDDEVEFFLEFTVEKCPELEERQHQYISIYSTGRKDTLLVDLSMHCKCKCEEKGDTGYIPDADECKRHGDYKCGVCSCHEGYVGRHCECEASQVAGLNVTSDQSCRMTNTSKVCSGSGMGTCLCGQCTCRERENLLEIISGKYCECTNYQRCTGPNGLKCSGKGDCVCNECQCNAGWTGKYCDCMDSQEGCVNPGTKEVCSNQGSCRCNQCQCNSQYFGKYCEDCSDCRGKCEDYRYCVQCQAFGTGEYSKGFCQSNCTLFNATKVPVAEVRTPTERLCSFYDDDCRFFFVYGLKDDGSIEIRVQETQECPKPINVLGVVIGVIVAIVVIGLVALIVWKIIVTLRDKHEYQKFILAQKDAVWIQSDNPLYKQATTTVQNPLFGAGN